MLQTICNLRWASKSLQCTNQRRRTTDTRKMIKRSVFARRLGTSEWQEFESANLAAKTLNLSSGNVVACCRRRYCQTGNWEFQYKTTLLPTSSGTDIATIRKHQNMRRSLKIKARKVGTTEWMLFDSFTSAQNQLRTFNLRRCIRNGHTANGYEFEEVTAE